MSQQSREIDSSISRMQSASSALSSIITSSKSNWKDDIGKEFNDQYLKDITDIQSFLDKLRSLSYEISNLHKIKSNE